ncbi:enoyl-CoA hydratase-isomerase [Syntrophobacter sp. SbD1]|nr:enoyl-CoA hydratase-isomerase [Syntrophobacter sp. SbD1]
MTYDTIVASVEDQIGIIQLNRPEALNALNDHLLSELAEVLKNFLKDDKVRCIIIAGGEKAFCAGADVNEMISREPRDILDRFTSSIFGLLRHCPKPVIAAVSGYCFAGGCELALACDMIVASETAKFGQPEINVGIMPGAGGTQRWTRTVGKARAMEVMLTGAPIDARKALEWGIVNRVAPVEELLNEAKRLAAAIAAKPAFAARMVKDAVLKAQDMPLESGLDYENRLFAMLFGTDDQKEGMRAFLEKRKPQWK